MSMKQYVIDELRLEDYGKLKKYLDDRFEADTLNGLYWLKIDDDLLSPVQEQHKDCQPFYLALELEEQRLTCELLVRSRSRIRCDCIAYANRGQFDWAVRLIDNIFKDLAIIT